MFCSERAPGALPQLAVWRQGRGCAAVRYPSGSRRGRRGQGDRGGQSFERSPSEKRRRTRRRRRRRRRSRTGSPLLRPVSWPPLLGSSPPAWRWCRLERSRGHRGWPGGLHCAQWSGALCWGSLCVALYHRSTWERGSTIIQSKMANFTSEGPQIINQAHDWSHQLRKKTFISPSCFLTSLNLFLFLFDYL